MPTRAGLRVYQERRAQVVCAGLRCGCRIRLLRRVPVRCAVHRPRPVHGVLRCHVPRRVPCGVCCAALAATSCCVGPAAAACALGCTRGRRRLGVQREVVKWVAWAGGGLCARKRHRRGGGVCSGEHHNSACACVYTQGRQRSCVCRCTLCVHVQRTQVCAHSSAQPRSTLHMCTRACVHTQVHSCRRARAQMRARLAGVVRARTERGSVRYAGGTHGLCVGKSIRPCPGRMRVHAQAGACGLGACVHRRAGVCAGDVCAREEFARAQEVLVHGRWLCTGDGCAQEVFVHGKWLCAGDVRAPGMFVHTPACLPESAVRVCAVPAAG